MRIAEIKDITITDIKSIEEVNEVVELLRDYLQDNNELRLFVTDPLYADVIATFNTINFSPESENYLEFKNKAADSIEMLATRIAEVRIYVEGGRCICRIFFKGVLR